jgi:hypothetical protein
VNVSHGQVESRIRWILNRVDDRTPGLGCAYLWAWTGQFPDDMEWAEVERRLAQ